MSAHFAPESERTLSAAQYLAGTIELAVIVGALLFAALRLRRALLPGYTGVAGPGRHGRDCDRAGDRPRRGWSAPSAPSPTSATWSRSLACRILEPVCGLGPIRGVTGAAEREAAAGAGADRFRTAARRDLLCRHLRRLGDPDADHARRRHGPRRLALVPHARSPSISCRPGSTQQPRLLRPDLLRPLLSGELRAAARDPDPRLRPRLPLAADQPRLPGARPPSAWAIGRPFGVGPQACSAPRARSGRRCSRTSSPARRSTTSSASSFMLAVVGDPRQRARGARGGLALDRLGPLIAVAGLGAGLAAGTKLSFLVPVALIAIGVLAVAPQRIADPGRRRWFSGRGPDRRRLLVRPQPRPGRQPAPAEPVRARFDLPSPPRDFELRPGFSVAHYFTDGAVWQDWFIPGLHEALGPALAGDPARRLRRRRLRAVEGPRAAPPGARRRWPLVSAIAYVFTPADRRR